MTEMWMMQNWFAVITYAIRGGNPIACCLLVLAGAIACYAESDTAVTGSSGLRGRVVGQVTGQPVDGVAVQTQPESGGKMQRKDFKAGRGGVFECRGLSPGRYYVRVFGTGRLCEETTKALVVAGRLTDIGDLPLGESCILSGRVLQPDGRLAAGVEVGLHQSRDEIATTVTGAHGDFRFTGLPPEKTFVFTGSVTGGNRTVVEFHKYGEKKEVELRMETQR